MTTENNADIQNSPETRGKPPIQVIGQNAAKVKIWENENKDGKPFFKATVSQTYMDAESGQFRENNSFSLAQLRDVQTHITHAVHTMELLEAGHPARENDVEAKMRRELSTLQSGINGLKAQRDLAIANAKPDQSSSSNERQPSRAPSPDNSR